MKAIEWVSGKVRIIDQTKLPWEEVFLEISDYREVVAAIKEMRIRGAPAIGIAAAYGLALGAQGIETKSKEEFLAKLVPVSETLSATRPTAVNLFWALERMNRVAKAGESVAQIKAALLAEAQMIDAEGEAAERKLSSYGAELIKDGFTILTHCNTGALAAGYGTALGIIRTAWERGKKIHVFVGETRPLLQGARLTAWELKKYDIPFTLIADTMTGHFLSRGGIDCVIVGADRIASNGDVANKIGTYNLAVLAMENGVPFYVAAPTSTIDISLASGDEIPIEERNAEEVTHIRGVPIAPEGVRVANPAFDITPHRYISAIITERGVIREPYEPRLGKIID
ncbi:MAG: methylthioribose-1-phosphate isomerase [Dehalococcoidia bacterium DG_18]|nr:MAG: methylthioribose-1-phosphate isomerase [Dehalococcoidia bacterium DG_18]